MKLGIIGAMAVEIAALKENMEKLHFIAGFLFKNEIMEEEQFNRAMDEEGVTYEELEEMVAEKRRRDEEEDRMRREAEEAARQKDEEKRLQREEEEKNSNKKF